MPNRLANETSPYLLQHKDNPVDWYPWGEEAFARAREEDKPIFLSIGYSACHWCHVMEHESFEDEATAALMNEHFINVKVDREERPDVDSIYMNAVQALTQRGGWPMSVWLTPEGRPFYGGTYFPKESRYGMPSFKQVLTQLARVYREQRDAVEQDAARLTQRISGRLNLAGGGGDFDETILDIAFQSLAQRFDSQWGGFDGAPKFPPSMALELLLRLHARRGWPKALEMATFTLGKMMNGGMYDQLGGGFHRYSVDEKWLVPHFEKMLYDNALLLRAYLYAYQITEKPAYRRIVEEIAAYLRREMTSPEGGFYSTQDADSEGEEGKFFVWSEAEIREVLGDQVTHVDAVLDYWAVEEGGNFEGHSILWVPDSAEEVAARNGLTVEALLEQVNTAKSLLFEAREQRIKPGRDEKILTAWNGLMITGLAQAARALNDDTLLKMAVGAAEFVLDKLYNNGRLQRSYKDEQAKFNAYLEDYAFFAEGLIELYQSTFDLRWLQHATTLTETMLAYFWEDDAGFYDTSSDHEKLVTRPQELTDNATPSGTSGAVAVLLRMAILAGRPEWAIKAERILHQMARAIQGYPRAFAYLACQADFVLSEPQEIALVGERGTPALEALLAEVRGAYRPNKVTALLVPGSSADEAVPLLKGRTLVNGSPAAYVCRHFTCKLPVTTPESLAEQLE